MDLFDSKRQERLEAARKASTASKACIFQKKSVSLQHES